jgi:hypothetical protein
MYIGIGPADGVTHGRRRHRFQYIGERVQSVERFMGRQPYSVGRCELA